MKGLGVKLLFKRFKIRLFIKLKLDFLLDETMTLVARVPTNIYGVV